MNYFTLSVFSSLFEEFVTAASFRSTLSFCFLSSFWGDLFQQSKFDTLDFTDSVVDDN